jgi:hypothetical protein
MKKTMAMLSASVVGLWLAGTAVPASAEVPTPETIAAAKTPADHEAIAKAYENEAVSLEKLAAAHKGLEQTYGQPGLKPAQAMQAKHCESVSSELAAAAKNERALAAEHRKMAKETPGTPH